VGATSCSWQRHERVRECEHIFLYQHLLPPLPSSIRHRPSSASPSVARAIPSPVETSSSSPVMRGRALGASFSRGSGTDGVVHGAMLEWA
jgi:hypothetical protein